MSVDIYMDCHEKKGSGVARLPSYSHRIHRLIALQYANNRSTSEEHITRLSAP